MNARSQIIISHIYAEKEGYKNTLSWFCQLKEHGLDPRYLSMDGEQSVMRAIHEVWPRTNIQRCLYHIQREGMRWLRTYPKTEAGTELRMLLKTLCRIRKASERDVFISTYMSWLGKYRDFVKALPRREVAYKDLKRTMALIFNALPDMFHYLSDSCVPKTTNTLESFYSRLKADYRKHRGLTGRHKISYLSWYCYFKNLKRTNTL
jgi:transposase-like protein